MKHKLISEKIIKSKRSKYGKAKIRHYKAFNKNGNFEFEYWSYSISKKFTSWFIGFDPTEVRLMATKGSASYYQGKWS